LLLLHLLLLLAQQQLLLLLLLLCATIHVPHRWPQRAWGAARLSWCPPHA
jgi:hypothetical protein